MSTYFKHISFIIMLLLSGFAGAESLLQIEDAWVRQPPPGASAAAAYLKIHNPSPDDYYVTGVESPVFAAVELHQTREEDGLAKMIHHNFYKVEAESVFEARPGSYHLMLFRWQSPLQAGDVIPFELKLGNGDRVAFEAVVKRQ